MYMHLLRTYRYEIVKESVLVQTNSGAQVKLNVHRQIQRGTLLSLKHRAFRCFRGDMVDKKTVQWKGWRQDESFLIHRFDSECF